MSQTATNPQTGERVVMQGGQWVPVGASAPSAPRYVAPIIGGTDTYKASNDARAEEELRLRREREARDANKDNLQLSQDSLTAGVPDAAGDAFKAKAFLRKGIDSLRMYQEQGVGPRGLAENAFQGSYPNAQNTMDDPKRQVAQAMQEAFVKAILRPESGAVIGPDEMKGYLADYFPRPGASSEEIEAKRKIRLSSLNGLFDMSLRAMTPEDRANYRKMIDELSQVDGTAAADGNGTIDPATGALNVTVTDTGDAPATPPDQPTDVGRALGLGVGDLVEGVGDTLGLVANPLNAGINAVLGTNLGTDLGQAFRDATGLPSPQNDSEQLASSINKGGVGALSMAGAAGGAANITTGVAQNALSRFAAAPAIDAVSGMSGAASGEVARQNGASVPVQIGASLLGGAGGAMGASRIAQMGAKPVMNDLMRAGKTEGVDVNRAMVDRNVQPKTTGVQSTMAGGPIVNRNMAKISGQIESGVQKLGQGGTPLENNVGGQMVGKVAERFIKKAGKQSRREYDQAEAAAGDVKIQPQESGAEIGSLITRLSETANTNSAEIAYLKGLEADLSKGLSVGALRDLRTTLRQKISKGELTFGQNEKRVLGIMDAISTDLETGLRGQGKEAAARLFANADKNYRARQEFITGTLQKIIGKRNSNLSAEAVFNNFKAMAAPKGDEAGLARMMRTMEPDEQADVAATFADALGKKGEKPFSTATLVTQAGNLPQAARVNLFGQEGAASLDRLVKLAREHSRVTGSFNNSKTGTSNDWRSWLTSLVLGGGGPALASVVAGGGVSGTAVAGAAGAGTIAAVKGGRDVLSARAVMSTELSKWLASAPRTTSPKAIDAHYNRLAEIAVRQPALQADIKQLQQRINAAANDFTGKAAASGPVAGDDEANSRKAPPAK